MLLLKAVMNGYSGLRDANAAGFEDRGRRARAPDQRGRRSTCTRLSIDGRRATTASTEWQADDVCQPRALGKSYLGQAGLLEATKRAHFRITDRGRKVLAEGPARIDNKYLSQFAEFIKFRERHRIPGTPVSSNAAEIHVTPVQTQTPDELLRSTVMQIETALRKELLDRVLVAPPKFFESLIVTLLLAMGYGGSREDSGQIVADR
jgi:restriction endonuclease Mrr